LSGSDHRGGPSFPRPSGDLRRHGPGPGTDHPSVIVGDCREVVETFEPASFVAVVTDPPYELGFMGKAWDRAGVAFEAETWHRLLRVTQPGGHLLAFGSTRKYHRLVVAIEDAGWEVRDTILWLYAQGMPKGPNLKPAWEPILLARRPGRGALRVDDPAVLLPYADEADAAVTRGKNPGRGDLVTSEVYGADRPQQRVNPGGRHPANVMLTDPVLDGGYEGIVGAGDVRGEGHFPSSRPASMFRANDHADAVERRLEPGSYSRIFLVPKASRREREEGLGGRELRPLLWSSGTQNPGSFQSAGTRRSSTNPHPTVKPVELMEHLIRLVAAPGERILDPFVGSGSTLVAAQNAQVDAVGIELDPEYAEVAEWRRWHARGLGL